MNDLDVNDILFQQSVPMLLHAGLDAVMPAYRQLFTKHGLTEQQWRVLRVLWNTESLSSIEISRQTLIQPNSLVGVLERLEKRGYVARVRSVKDRRIIFAKLTPEGRDLGRMIAPALRVIHEDIQSRLTPLEWNQLDQLMAKATMQQPESFEERDHG